MARQIITYNPIDRPDVEVLVDDEWLPAEVRQWTQHADRSWTANCSWHRDHSTYLDEFPAERVREDTADRSRGRDRHDSSSTP